jgi:hypothetical protein
MSSRGKKILLWKSIKNQKYLSIESLSDLGSFPVLKEFLLSLQNNLAMTYCLRLSLWNRLQRFIGTPLTLHFHLIWLLKLYIYRLDLFTNIVLVTKMFTNFLTNEKEIRFLTPPLIVKNCQNFISQRDYKIMQSILLN